MSTPGLTFTGDSSVIEWKNKDSVKFVGAGLSVKVEGKNNRIIVGNDVWFNGFNIEISSDNNTIIIGDRTRVTGKVIMKLSPNNELHVGDGTTIGGATFVCAESKAIKIGKDCMLSWGIEARTTDSHPIVIEGTEERINWAKDIVLEDRVWVGAGVTLLKGAYVSKNSVIGMKSVVTKKFEESNVVIGGFPAEVIKQKIDWRRPLLG